MLPLFLDEACIVTIMRHCFEVIHAAVQYINPGHIPVINVDQPLLAKMKQLQWSMDTLYGEDKFVLLHGGLHTELTPYKCQNHWLEGSGWVEVIQESKLASVGVVESFFPTTHKSYKACPPSRCLNLEHYNEQCIPISSTEHSR